MAKKLEYTVSRQQLNQLIERAGKDAVAAALIQNGSTPEGPPGQFTVSRPQLKKLIERVGKDAVERALIQNGSAPE